MGMVSGLVLFFQGFYFHSFVIWISCVVFTATVEYFLEEKYGIRFAALWGNPWRKNK
jgi:hypothetical protein